MLLQPCSAEVRTLKKLYLCTSDAANIMDKEDQELFLFKPYSEILSKADFKHFFFPWAFKHYLTHVFTQWYQLLF